MGNETIRGDRPRWDALLQRALEWTRLNPASRESLRAGEQVPFPDRYTPRLLNEVMRNLQSFFVIRQDRASELGAGRPVVGHHHPETGQHRYGHAGRATHHEPFMIMRDGRPVVVQPDELEALVRAGKISPEQARAIRAAPASGVESPLPARSERGEFLSLFEKIFLTHFEGGVPLGELLEKGKFKFLVKSEKAWMEFFQRFLPFTFSRTISFSELKALIFRGLLQESGKAQQAEVATLISDLQFLNGKTDKFARLPVRGLDVLQKIASLMPGDMLMTSLLPEILDRSGQSELQYLSLSHKIVNPDTVKESPSDIALAYQSPQEMKRAAIREGVRDVTQGIALEARTERMIAERLDLNLKSGRNEMRIDSAVPAGKEIQELPQSLSPQGGFWGSIFGRRRRRAWFDGIWGASEPNSDTVFVPWYSHWIPFKRHKGKIKWYIPLLYFVGISTSLLFCVYVCRLLLEH